MPYAGLGKPLRPRVKQERRATQWLERPEPERKMLAKAKAQHHFLSDWDHPLDPFGDFVAELERRGLKVRLHGDHARAQCPAHDDHDPSLDVKRAPDGTVLMVCRSHGCSAEEICAAVDYPMRHLFPGSQVVTDPNVRRAFERRQMPLKEAA